MRIILILHLCLLGISPLFAQGNPEAEIFQKYPWAKDRIYFEDCGDISLTEYTNGEENYLFQDGNQFDQLYTATGQLRCSAVKNAGIIYIEEDGNIVTMPDESITCQEVFELVTIVDQWFCQEPSDTIMDTEFSIESILETYPWIATIADLYNCTGTIEEYSLSGYKFLLIKQYGQTKMYFQTGAFYCMDTPNYSCKEAYGLGSPNFVWNCENTLPNETPFVLQRTYSNPSSELNAYPNPSNGRVFLELSEPYSFETKVSVYNATGRVILEKWIGASIPLVEIDMSNFNKGLYLFQHRVGNTVYSRKVLLKE